MDTRKSNASFKARGTISCQSQSWDFAALVSVVVCETVEEDSNDLVLPKMDVQPNTARQFLVDGPIGVANEIVHGPCASLSAEKLLQQSASFLTF